MTDSYRTNSDSGDACRCEACMAERLVPGTCFDCDAPIYVAPDRPAWPPARCEHCARIARIFPRPVFIAKPVPRA